MFGYTSTGSSLLSLENQICGGVFYSGSVGSAESISCYVQTNGTTAAIPIKFALYEYNSSGTPKPYYELKGTTETLYHTTDGFNTLYVRDSWGQIPNIDTGVPYALCAWASSHSGATNCRVDYLSGEKIVIDSEAFGNWPNKLSTLTLKNYVMSIYCELL